MFKKLKEVCSYISSALIDYIITPFFEFWGLLFSIIIVAAIFKLIIKFVYYALLL